MGNWFSQENNNVSTETKKIERIKFNQDDKLFQEVRTEFWFNLILYKITGYYKEYRGFQEALLAHILLLSNIILRMKLQV